MFQSSLATQISAHGDAAADAARDHGPPLHVAIVMDGNGRWAQRRGRPRSEGHRAGAAAVRRTVTAARAQGIATLTLYAFSSDNWRRPAGEVNHLMHLFRMHLRTEADRCLREGVRVSVIGRRDRLAPRLVAAIDSIEARTRAGGRLHLQLAVDYSARDAILEAARLYRAGPAQMDAPPSPASPRSCAPSRELFGRLIARALHADHRIPDVDLLIRTGGEQRLSDFLLWECAYAEIVFTPCLWPDFDETGLQSAVREFRSRERRYGSVPARPFVHPSRPLPPSPCEEPPPAPVPGTALGRVSQPSPGASPGPSTNPAPGPSSTPVPNARRGRAHRNG